MRRSASFVLAFVFLGCGSRSEPRVDAPSVDFDRQALLANLGENIVLPTYEAFDASVASLVGAVGDYCIALGTPGEEAALAAAQEAWKEAMAVWQRAEMMVFGPAAMDSNDLRDKIYSWPVVNSCAVDQDVMLRWNDPQAYDIATRLPNRKGLDALEYVLFAESLETTCAPVVAPEGWDQLTDEQRKQARCGYADVAAADVHANAQALVQAWSPSGGNYVGALATAGDAGSTFSSAHEAINHVSNAMFALDTDVKDMRLGEPAGVSMSLTCPNLGEPCPEALESKWAHVSKENVVENLTAWRMMFLGEGPEGRGTGVGFDDFLAAAMAADLAAEMSSDLDAALAAAEAIPGTLADAIVNDRQAVVDAHAAVKKVTDDLKSRFVTVLGLELPNDETDND